MANRTQIVCLHEGEKGRSIDPVFINRLIKTLNPSWLRPFTGSNRIRLVGCGGRKDLVKKMPAELLSCIRQGGQTTLMVWADLDHDMADGDELKEVFWRQAESEGITREQFSQVVFAFAKDRLENWIQFLLDGATTESVEGPRIKDNRQAINAARTLAERCRQTLTDPPVPPSLEWSCRNWREFAERMKRS